MSLTCTQSFLSQVASEVLNDAMVTFISGKKPTPKQATPTQSPELSVAVNASSVLYRDAFGFAKVIVAITSTGKIYGIHSTGSILWSRILGLDLGMILPNPKLHVIRSVLDGAITPIVAVVANRQDGSVSIFQPREVKSPVIMLRTGNCRASSGCCKWESAASWGCSAPFCLSPGL